ncbi:carboxypeptidase regulatory-like domain-containing protein [Geothrix sp. PMB-07]|uniref:TonB-dependent receptor n=1 Tax=Geothrix sp. PMB-07 TaxID=3068640 RepID=UPI0027428C4B|nr:carboxypeptidase regulatory-like domain-containing protein [Geothrix sp. PMB-07]WLT31930.1 carboxypeptidase regulatory-like domain-containing protein [Geothrix sp. PMB-07]
MHRIFTRLGFTAAALVAGSGTVLHAQSSTTGSVSGIVTDATGNPVSGVAVTATSAQISRFVVTAADGSFRLGLLNPGQWSITFSKTGLSTSKQYVSVLTNQNQPINVKMATEAKATVEVVASSASIDTTSTTQGQTLTAESISSLPTGRDFNSLAFFTPGVISSGFGSDPSVGGGSAAENTYIVDGLNTTDFRRGFQGQNLATDFIDQYEVQTGGYKPEFSALGGVFNAVTKSGSNDFKGSSWLNIDPRSLKADRKKGLYAKQSPTDDRYDIGAQLGGALQKDKLFYFVGLSYIDSKAPGDTNRNLAADGGIQDKQLQFVGKLNWYLTLDQQFTFFVNVNDHKRDTPQARPLDGDANWGASLHSTTNNLALNYDWTISPALFLSVKLGKTELKDDLTPEDQSAGIDNGNWYRTGPGFLAGNQYGIPFFGTSRAPRWQSGGYGVYDSLSKNDTTQFKIDLSYFLGDHNLKFGVSYLDSKYQDKQATTGGNWHRIRGASPAGIYMLDQYNWTDATVENAFTAFYAQDSWSLSDSGFRLMYGFRYEKQELKDYQGKTYLKFDNFSDLVQPRLGFTWDIKKDGTIKLAGSVARYFESIPQRLGIRVFANEIYTRTRYNSPTSVDSHGVPNPGSFNYNFTTAGFTYNPSGPNNGVTDYATPFSFDPIADGTKLPERREYTLGLDWNFAKYVTAGIHGRYRKMVNPIEDSVITDALGNELHGDVSGGSAILWNPHPGQVSYRTSPYNGSVPVTGNSLYPEAGNTYKSVDLTLDYKGDRLTFGASYTWSRLEGNYEGLVSSSNGQADNNITASFDYYPYVGYGLLPNDRTSVVKVYGSYRFALGFADLNLGWNYSFQSGTPISLFDEGSTTMGLAPGTLGSGNIPLDMGNYGNATPANGKMGQYGRTPGIQNIDVHADLQFKSGKLKIVPSIDIFNLANSRKELTEIQQATDATGNLNPAWQSPNSWQTGRAMRFGVKLVF